MTSPNLARFGILAAFFVTATNGFGFDTAYWVWQRESPLGASESSELARQNVHVLYWHVGELDNTGETWKWKARFSIPAPNQSELRYVPAVRLVSHERQPFTEASLAALLNALAPLTGKRGELHLDYDCPDRLLGNYAVALEQIHRLVRRLTITALPHWGRAEDWKQLAPSIDEFLPMFYDFEPKTVLQESSTSPLLDPDKLEKMLRDWNACSKPWRAGLPAFARLTVYEQTGKARGQIRNWNWEELCRATGLENEGPSRLGTTILRVTQPNTISHTPLRPGDRLVVRRVDQIALQNAIAATAQTTAQGVVFFRLPDSTAAAGLSLRQLGHLAAKPELVLRKSASSETLELVNRGDGDLEPRFGTSATGASGYYLELKSPVPIFREAEPGDSQGPVSHGNRWSAEIRAGFFRHSNNVYLQSSARGRKYANGIDSTRARGRFSPDSLPNPRPRRKSLMEINRMKLASIACFCFLGGATAYATGGDEYEVPVKLGDSFDMLPGKSLGEIFLETGEVPSAEEPLQYEKPIQDLMSKIGKVPAPELLKAADKFVAEARLHWPAGTNWCNLAHDVRDAAIGSADNPDAAREYIRWRLEHLALFGINLDKAGTSNSSEEAGNKTDFSEVDQRAEAVTGSIKANWLFAAGAARFKSGDRANCQPCFDRVIKEFPKHPRAEVAMFLNARCALSASRNVPDEDKETEEAKKRKEAVAKFEAFRKSYPRGRLDADALGWLGALACDGKEYLKALDYYIAQAETPNHPETLVTAIHNCEKALAHLAPKPRDDAAFALIARHPRIAMAFTYLVISAPEADNYDGEVDNPSDVKKWRRTILPKIAAAVAKQKESYKSSDWQPRYLAMLILAASGSGNQAQALQLSQISPDQLKKSDDLSFARAITLQRANKTQEAIDALQTFLRTFPETPMKAGATVRLALALQDNHQAGEAIAILHHLLPKPSRPDSQSSSETKKAGKDEEMAEDGKSEEKTSEESTESAEETPAVSPDALGSRYTGEGHYPAGESEWRLSESAVYPNISGADTEQIWTFIDALLNFAPLSELAGVPSDKRLDQATQNLVRAVLAERYLALENFVEGKKFVTDKHQQELISKLEELTNEKPGTNQEKAERMLRLGDAWAQARGALLRAPLDTELHNGGPIPGLFRRDNGQALGVTDTDALLDDRDELHHASRWWMRAARLVPGTPVAAKARLKALEALPQIARVSAYTEKRAREIKLESVSREIYDKLRAESPNSPEAQRFAAYWSVPPLPKQTNETPYSSWNSNWYEGGEPALVSCGEETAFGYPLSDNKAFDNLTRPSSEDEQAKYRLWQEVEKRVLNLRNASATSEAKELAELVRKNVRQVDDASTANCLDDLAQFLSEPDLPREARDVYVNLRLDLLHRTHWSDSPVDPGISVEDSDTAVEAEIEQAKENPAFESFRDYLDFCSIGLVAGNRIEVETNIKDPKDPNNPVTYHSRDYAEIEKMTREFLTKYPKSHRRDAAMFLLARAVYSLSRPYIACIGIPTPGAYPGEEGVVDVVQKTYSKEPFKPELVMQALDNYDKAFPNGRYTGDVRDMRAATLWRMGQWDKALDLTLAQISDKTKLDLVSTAETRLANIFAELANVEHRPDVLASIKAHPAALPYLQAYLAKATNDRAHPLRYLQVYLSDQFHIKIPEATDAVASN